MEETIESLIPIVTELVRKYTGGDSTSITYEKAQMLMSGVLYCLHERKSSPETTLSKGFPTVTDEYNRGLQLVQEKAIDTRRIYNQVIENFDAYGMICLEDTIVKGMPEFFKWYDTKFFPQNTILTLDYPLLLDLHTLCGVDAVHMYMRAIRVEQLFLRKFKKSYVTCVLENAIPGYEQMIENICEPVLLNTLGHLLLGKSLEDVGFDSEEYDALSQMFQTESFSPIERTISVCFQNLLEKEHAGDSEILSYFEPCFKNLAVRIHTAVQCQSLDHIFVY